MAQNKKELIRTAAVKVFSKYGFHGASTDKIAAEAGVAVGTIYNYFKNKEDILNYIFEIEYDKRVSFFEEVQAKDIHPLEKIKLILIKHFEELKKNPEIVQIVLNEKNFPPCRTLGGIEKFEGLPLFISKILQQGIDTGVLRECKVEVVSLVLFGAIERIMLQYLLEYLNHIDTGILDKSIEEIYSLLLRGIVR